MLDLSENILAVLPERSRLKLERHAADRAAAYASYRAASDAEQQARIDHGLAVATMRQRQSLPQGVTFSRQPADPEAEARLAAPVEAAERALKAATAARERAAERQSAFAFLDTVAGWLRRAAIPGVMFEAVKPDPARTKDPAAALVKVRAEIDALANDFATVENAPAPSDDLKKRAFLMIDAIAAEGAPTIYQTTRGGSPINLRRQLTVATRHTGSETNPVSIIGDGGASFFTWLMQDEIKKKISGLIDALPQDGALTDDEREQAFRDLAARRLAAERVEESLAEMTEADGRIVARRADIDPRAFLMIDA